MTELVATALTMVDSSAEDVRSAIVDYQDRRQLLLPEECEAYEVLAEDDGGGAKVAMTLALGQVIRNRRGGRRKKRAKVKQEPLRCVFRLEELTDQRIVERDTLSSLCTTWTLRPTDDDRTAVHVRVSWDAPAGAGNFLRRQNEKLAMRMLYENILTRLHELFLVDESAAEEQDSEEPHSPKQDTEDPPSSEQNSQDPHSPKQNSQDPHSSEQDSKVADESEQPSREPQSPEHRS